MESQIPICLIDENYNFLDIFPQTAQIRKRLWIYSLARKNSEDIQPIVSSHVETVVLLSQLRQKPDDYIDVDVDVAELEGTSAETKATYEKIKKYVAEHNDGMKVSNLYIAQVKRKCGIELAENFNLPKSEESRQPQCPKEKEEAIIWALKAFKMI